MSKSLSLPPVVEDALNAANRATSRRGFLKASGALVVTVSIPALPGGTGRRRVPAAHVYSTSEARSRDASTSLGMTCREAVSLESEPVPSVHFA